VHAVFASTCILILSVVLFVYWLRYVCLLILSSRGSRDYSRNVAEANGLAFLETRSALEASALEQAAFEALQRSLDRDYRLVTYLLRHAAGRETQDVHLHHWVLRLNYRLLSLWYSVVHRLSHSLARRALIDMSSVVSQLANAMGEQCALTVRA
jgi:hypothetical protein